MEATQDPVNIKLWSPPDPETQPKITDFFQSTPESSPNNTPSKAEASTNASDSIVDTATDTTETNDSPQTIQRKRGRPKKTTTIVVPPIQDASGDIFLGGEATVLTSFEPGQIPGTSSPTDTSLSEPSFKKRRRSFTVQQKQEVVEYAKQHSLYKAALEYKLSCGTVGPWMKRDYSTMESTSLRATGSGRKLSYPQKFEPVIAQWILEQRDIRPAITTHDIMNQACSLIKEECPNFRGTRGWYQKFLVRNSILNPEQEPLSKKLPAPLEEKIAAFIETVKKARSDYDYPLELIANMDEVIVQIDMVSNRKSDRSKTVVFPTYTTGSEKQSYTLGAEKQNIMVVLTALADGQLLPPMIVFKGVKVPKHINMPSGWLICVHEHGYFDSSLMELWMKDIWLKHTQSRKSLLLMDHSHPHLTEDYAATLAQSNTVVSLIPPGCSTKLQPVTVALAEPLNKTCRVLFSSYYQSKLSSLQNPGDRLRSASKEDICPWLIAGFAHIATMQEEVVSAFKATGLTLALDGLEDNLYRINQSKPEKIEPAADIQVDTVEEEPPDATTVEIVADQTQEVDGAITELDNSLHSLKTLYSYMLQMQNKALSDTDMQLLEEQLQSPTQ